MTSDSIVILGTGLAGYMLAKEIRKINVDKPLMLITTSDGAFYSKPLLSTSLTAKRDVTKIATADVATMSKQLNAEIRVATRVTKINIEQKTLEIIGETIPYGKLVLAIGAEVIKSPVLGDANEDILAVNDLEDYARFREIIAGKKSIAILGAGLVGCEFANDLIKTGYQVDVIDPALYPLQRLLPEGLGRVLEQALKNSGCHWHFGKLVSEIHRRDNFFELILSYQEKLEVDVVMSAIGLRPNTELAQAGGIKTNYGILVDQFLATSAPDIYALGDCAEVSGLVLFFVAPLLHCASALAKTLLDSPTKVTYPMMPVVLKTPSCPIVIASPPRNVLGNWIVEGEGNDLQALYFDTNNKLTGFALTGKKVIEKNKLLQQMPALLI